jgi:hypothetical protein
LRPGVSSPFYGARLVGTVPLAAKVLDVGCLSAVSAVDYYGERGGGGFVQGGGK